MISDSLESCTKKTEFQKFKDYEKIKYKDLHRCVLSDTGVPNLHKRGYKMPGYREVIHGSTLEDGHLDPGQNSAFIRRPSFRSSSRHVTPSK